MVQGNRKQRAEGLMPPGKPALFRLDRKGRRYRSGTLRGGVKSISSQ